MKVNEELVKEIIRKKLKKCGRTNENFTLKSFEMKSLDDNYGLMGEHAKLTTHFHLKDTLLKEHFFLKGMSHVEAVQMVADQVFRKECATYEFFTDIINHVPLISETIPECYLNRDDLLVFQDLCHEGFEQLDVQHVPTIEQLEITLKTLAKIHASCIIYEEHSRKKFGRIVKLNEKYPMAFKEIYLDPNRACGDIYLKCLIKGVQYQLELYDLPRKLKNGEDIAENAHRFLKLLQSSAPSKSYRNVITHCDLNFGNIFYKWTNAECKIIDFQICRYKPPAHDVACLLYTNTTRKFREENLNKLLTFYYEWFSRYLSDHGVNPVEILTFEDFLKSYELEKPLATFYELKSTCLLLLQKEDMAHFLSSDIMWKTYNDSFAWIFKTYRRSALFDQRSIDGVYDFIEILDKNLI